MLVANTTDGIMTMISIKEDKEMKTNDRIIELVKKVKASDNDAFTDLYNESYKYLHTCVIHIVKDEDVAQDMLQDTYVEIYKNIGQLKDDAGFIGWASTIANRKCFAYLKKNKDVLVDEQTDDEGNSTDYFENIADDEAFIPENIFDNIEKINIIRGIIDELTDVQRACVIGFYYNEQKQDQIADELGIPVNTVKSHLNRAKFKIKEAVGDIEMKQGIKLLSVIPFMVALFGFETEAYAAELVVPAMSASVAGTVATKGAISTGTATVKATGAAAKSAGMALKTKIAIGALVGALGIGAIVGTMFNRKNEESKANVEEIADETDSIEDVQQGVEDEIPYVDVYIDMSELTDIIKVFGKTLTGMERKEIIGYFGNKENACKAEGITNESGDGSYESITYPHMMEYNILDNSDTGYTMHKISFYNDGTETESGLDFSDVDIDLDMRLGKGVGGAMQRYLPDFFSENEGDCSAMYLTYPLLNGGDWVFESEVCWNIFADGKEFLSIGSGGIGEGDDLIEAMSSGESFGNDPYVQFEFRGKSTDSLIEKINPKFVPFFKNGCEMVEFQNGNITKVAGADRYTININDAIEKGYIFNSMTFCERNYFIRFEYDGTREVSEEEMSITTNAIDSESELSDEDNDFTGEAPEEETNTIDNNKAYWITLWYQGEQTVDELYYKMSKDSDWIFVGDNPLVAGDGYDVRVPASDINGYMAIKSVVNGKEYISESNNVHIGYVTFVMKGVEEPHYADGDSFDYVNAYFGLGGDIGMDWY